MRKTTTLLFGSLLSLGVAQQSPFVQRSYIPVPSAPVQNDPFWITARSFTTVGGNDGDGEYTRHAHDPNGDYYLQSLDLGLNLQPTDWFAGFFNLTTFQGAEGLDSEWEEGFVKFIAPDDTGLELRAGRYRNRLGRTNALCVDGWDYVDANLSLTHFFGDEGLYTEGAEISWRKDFEKGFFHVSNSYGQVVAHAHHHDEHEGHDEHEDEGGFEDELFTSRALLQYNITDFHQNTLGLNYAKAVGGGDLSMYGADYEYQWRENGLENGGRSVSVVGEYLGLDDGEEVRDSLAFSTMYDFGNGFSIGGRYEWIEFEAHHEEEEEEPGHDEEEEHELGDRKRFSAVLTYRRPFLDNWMGQARAQYNYDQLDSGESRQGAWFQLGFYYGSPEIR